MQETLNVAQSLYETHKATTYPRSDSGYLPQSMFAEVPTVLEALRVTDPGLQPLFKTLDPAQRSRAWNDSKITAHPGIIPTLEPTSLSAMSENERAVYRLIRAHYLAQFLPHHEYERTLAQLSCSDAALRARGKRGMIAGWRSVFDEVPTDTNGEDGEAHSQVLPPLAPGARSSITHVELKALKTLPPKPFTQGELIAAMKGVARVCTAGLASTREPIEFVTSLDRQADLRSAGQITDAADSAETVFPANLLFRISTICFEMR